MSFTINARVLSNCAFTLYNQLKLSIIINKKRILMKPFFTPEKLSIIELLKPFSYNAILTRWLSFIISPLFSSCAWQAQVAGKISVQQLNLGLRLGDPHLQSRCKLFYSISLIQTGHLRAAKYIIRQQYCFALKEREKDIRLVRMCKGIWLRLQYEYLQRQLKNLNKNSLEEKIIEYPSALLDSKG